MKKSRLKTLNRLKKSMGFGKELQMGVSWCEFYNEMYSQDPWQR